MTILRSKQNKLLYNKNIVEKGQQCSDRYDSDDQLKDQDKEHQGQGDNTRCRIHATLLAGGINIRPSEIRPLLRALGVDPWRFVRLGLVDPEALCNVVH